MAKKLGYSQDDRKKIEREVAMRAWKDPKFKARLLKDPKAVLKEMGLEVPERIEIRVVEDKENVRTYVLPLPPSDTSETELPPDVLEKLAAGSRCNSCAYTYC